MMYSFCDSFPFSFDKKPRRSPPQGSAPPPKTLRSQHHADTCGCPAGGFMALYHQARDDTCRLPFTRHLNCKLYLSSNGVRCVHKHDGQGQCPTY